MSSCQITSFLPDFFEVTEQPSQAKPKPSQATVLEVYQHYESPDRQNAGSTVELLNTMTSVQVNPLRRVVRLHFIVAPTVSHAVNHLGYTELRPQQELAIKTFLAGHDVFVCLPTGSGKSLCYCVLPAAFDHISGNPRPHLLWWW